MVSRALLLLALGAGLLAPAVARAETVRLGSGDWTYFTDPRVVSLGGAVYTGWISTTGRVTVTKFVPKTGKHHSVVVGRTGVDDHNNPSLHVREDGRLMVFFSPHSGYYEPKGRVSRLYYRVAQRRHSIAAWGPTHHLPVNAPGRLGFTYPNPIGLPGGRIWLSWRGGGWLPTYSIYRGGRWSAAREIVRGPNDQRPYAKYAGGPDGSGVVHIAFTETHPSQSRTHVHYLQYRLGQGFFDVRGRRIGRSRDLPLRGNRSDLVHDYDEEGRSWVMDVADDGAGNPVIVYSVGFGRSRQYFRSARWTGARWLDRRIASAYATVRHGRKAGTFQTGGIVLDHRDPSIVYLSRIVADRGTVEAWKTPDEGRTWNRVRRLSPRGQNCYRPAAPVTGSQRVVLFVCGYQSHWQHYATTIRCSIPERSREVAWSYGSAWRSFPDAHPAGWTYRRRITPRRSTCPFASPSTASAASDGPSSAPASSARPTTASWPSTT